MTPLFFVDYKLLYMDILKDFIKSIDLPKAIHESVNGGFNIIFEGYSDVREEGANKLSFDAFNKAQRFAAQHSPAMDLILRSQEKLDNMYTYGHDEEDYLDNIAPTPFNQYIEPIYNDRGDSIEDSLGLTAADLSVRGKQAANSIKKQTIQRKKPVAALDFSDF